jgi:hypothetical protein
MHNNKHAMQCATDTKNMQCLTYSAMSLYRDKPEFGPIHVHGQGHITPHPILFPAISKDVMSSKIHKKFPMGKYNDLINSGKFVTILFALAPSRVMNVR